MINVTPVILAGGMGTRLRPLTSPSRAKPFVRFGMRNSLFQETLLRCAGMKDPIIVCYAPFADQVWEQCYEMGVKPRVILCEPAQRGTAAAIGAAALYMKEQGIEAPMLVMPSDHALEDVSGFFDAVQQAQVREGDLVLFGAAPRVLSERYGYIVHDLDFKLKRFVEKPPRSQIAALAGEGKVLWNSGVFMCGAHYLVTKLRGVQPEVVERVGASVMAARVDGKFMFLDSDAFMDLPRLSIDYAVMEHVRDAAVVVIRGRWEDVGTLSAFLQMYMRKVMKGFEV